MVAVAALLALLMALGTVVLDLSEAGAMNDGQFICWLQTGDANACGW